MPIDTIKHSIHIRRKKNKVVFDNIDRLWDIGRGADSAQDILDRLHPWNAPITLKFENVLPILLGIVGIFFIVPVFFAGEHIWTLFSFLFGLGCLLWAYLSYEQDDPLEEVTDYLEKQIIHKKYQLNEFTPPQQIGVALQPAFFIAHLKQLFPIFNQGTISNDIPYYASTTWQDEAGQQHQVLLFQYHFVDEIRVRDKDGNELKVKEVHKDLWGCFVFEVPTQGLAITAYNKKFYYPYSFPWHSSDIQINQKLKFFGTHQMQMAKLLSPAFVLRTADFFRSREGDLLFHPEKNILCYISPQNLFEISSKAKKINDISTLRGHLRTFKLPYLDRLESDLTQFLK